MTLQDVIQLVDLWVVKYLATFCLITIGLWGAIVLMKPSKKYRPIKDSAIFLLSIGALTLILSMIPEDSKFLMWAPLTWFSFAMLSVLELLWIGFLLEQCNTLFQRTVERVAHTHPR